MVVNIKNKKASHVGIVLSFVIFVTFLIFLYTIIEPATRVERGKEKTLELLVPELTLKLSEKMTTVTIDLTNYSEAGDKNCITLPSITGLSDMGVVTKNQEELIIPSTLRDDNTTDIGWKQGDNPSLKLYYSKELVNLDSEKACETVNKLDDFKYGLIKTNTYVFESKINDTLDSLKENGQYYEELKGNLNIPLGDEFGFGFRNNDGETFETEEREGLTNIYVEEIPIQYIDSEANIKSGFLIVKVW